MKEEKDPDDWDEDDNIFLYALCALVIIQIILGFFFWLSA